jgi:hypothetical protein
MNVPNILRLQPFLIDSGIINETRVKEVLGTIVMVHADVFQFEFDDDTVVGQVM